MIVPPLDPESLDTMRKESDRLRNNQLPSLTVDGGVLDGLLIPLDRRWKDGETRALEFEHLVNGSRSVDYVYVRRGNRAVFDAETTRLMWVEGN